MPSLQAWILELGDRDSRQTNCEARKIVDHGHYLITHPPLLLVREHLPNEPLYATGRNLHGPGDSRLATTQVPHFGWVCGLRRSVQRCQIRVLVMTF
jgi:hypothetical protein